MPEIPARPSDLLLKVTAPRVARGLRARPQLALDGPALRDRPVIVVQAPPGFGKTSLLAQWRLDHLARGSVVAWVNAQSSDDVERLTRSLALAVRVGAGRPTFGHVLLAGRAVHGLEGVTHWLAEVAQSALDLVLVVDEAERLGDGAREAVGYLVRNAPPNLRCIVAARAEVDLGLADLVAYGQCVRLGVAELRFTLEETLRLAQQRLGPGLDRDRVARLHELTEGWPLAVQLALSVDPSGRVPDVPAAGAAPPEQFVALLLRNLAPADLDFLTRVSLVKLLHPDLCAALVPGADTAARLERLVRETPVFVSGDLPGWVRMHALARAALRQRFDALPAQECRALHGRACDWLLATGLFEAAAPHALACGREDKAYDLAERSLYESIMARGEPASVLGWLARTPPDELDRRPRLLLAAAWALALSERHDEARRYVERLLAQPEADDSLRCEAALILGAAAVFADDHDAFAALQDPWAERPPLRGDALLQIHANRVAFRALQAGEPALARLRQQRGSHPFAEPGSPDRWGEYIVGLTYLWEGQPLMVEQLLAPRLASAESDLGRRSAFACIVAATVAMSRWERGLAEEATMLLADRLDVLERSALPEAVLQAFRVLARAARAGHNEQRALALLGGLEAVGIARRLPRLRLASLAEQVRLHAREFRAETCHGLVRQIGQLLEDPGTPAGPLWRRSVEGLVLVARAHAAIAAREWQAALPSLVQAEALAVQRKLGRDRIEAMALRAWVLDRTSQRSTALLQEAVTLAHAVDLRAVFDDAHPQLADWVRDSAVRTPPSALAAPAPVSMTDLQFQAAARAPATAALTPKERQVLELLARNLTNKEIALAMQVGEETIKWHVKNLFAKLDAGTRKQVVGRARILGFLGDES